MTTLALGSTGSIRARPLPLNWRRISALSGSFTLHLVVVAVLLIPPVAIELTRIIDKHPDQVITARVIEETVPQHELSLPIPPTKPVKRVVKTPTPTITMEKPTPIPDDAPARTIETAAPSDAGDHVAMPSTGAAGDIGAADSGPSALSYGTTSTIPYPIIALRNHEQGTVTLRVLVGADGKPQQVEIDHSSGSHALDIAARDAVRHWTFKPGMRGGIAYAAWAIVPVSFSFPQ